ncbi:MAG: CbiX/SirB N-terminal domain-containing protein [Paracoccaceae bacterium]
MRALLVAHGQPSDPAPAEEELALLAERVAAQLPGWQVGAATLAAPGALARAVRGGTGLVYPLFMAGGWFTRVHLPQRLGEAGGHGWRVLEPFGCDPAVQDLTVTLAAEAQAAGATELLLAAHGSFRSPAPAEIAFAMAARIARETELRRVEAAFIDQAPQLAQVKGFGPQAVCLPFFAARGGHVQDDLPAVLTGFPGPILPPVGVDARVPALIARAIAAQVRPA